MYSVSEEYKYNIVDCKTLALIGMLFYRTSIWNEGITCSRQLENIVGTVALWDVWFILLWYRVSSLETIDKIWTVRWKFVIITDSQYETTDRNGQLNSKVKLQNYLIFSLNCIDAYLSLQCICTGDNILLFFCRVCLCDSLWGQAPEIYTSKLVLHSINPWKKKKKKTGIHIFLSALYLKTTA